jgi:hypothetical protein
MISDLLRMNSENFNHKDTNNTRRVLAALAHKDHKGFFIRLGG